MPPAAPIICPARRKWPRMVAAEKPDARRKPTMPRWACTERASISATARAADPRKSIGMMTSIARLPSRSDCNSLLLG